MATSRLIPVLALAITLITASTAMAASHMAAPTKAAPAVTAAEETAPPAERYALSPEKQAVFTRLREEFRAKVHPIKEQLWAKRTTLDALSANPKTEPQQVTALVAEMSALREQIYKERLAFEDKVEKEVGPMMMHGGMGRGKFHGGGYGEGRGHGGGKHGGGEGPRCGGM